MSVYLALQSIPWEDTKILGVFTESKWAEQRLVDFVLDAVQQRQDPVDQVYLELASTFKVQEWATDGAMTGEFVFTEKEMIRRVNENSNVA